MPARTTRTEEPTASRKSTRNKMTPSAAAAARAASLLPTSSPSSKKKSTRQCPVETAKRTTKSETTASPAAGGGKKKQPRSPLKPSPASKKAPAAAAAAADAAPADAADATAAAATVTTKNTKQALALYDPHTDQRLGRLVLIPHVADAVANANSPNWVHGVTTEARLEEGKATGEYFVCLGTYKSADEANEAFTEMEARGEEVEYVEVDLPAMERQGRVFYVDGKKKPDHFKKKTKKPAR